MPEEGPVVTNSGPLIALASVGQLDLLRALYSTVLVPDAVWREVTEAGAGRPGARELVITSWALKTALDHPRVCRGWRGDQLIEGLLSSRSPCLDKQMERWKNIKR